MNNTNRSLYSLLQKYEDANIKKFLDEKKFLAYCKKNKINAKYLGEGVSRVCYLLKDKTVLKVDLDRATFSNQFELNNYKLASARERTYLAKLIWNSEKCMFLIQEYIPGKYGLNKEHDIGSKLRDKITSFSLYDLHLNNIGYRKGAPKIPVVFDYAC